MKTLEGKTALVTGAASGIGRAIAIELAKQKVDLFLVDLDHQRLAEAADEIRQHHHQITAHVADLTRTADIQGIVDRLLNRSNGVDILVNNAGIAFHGSTHNMTDDHWDRVLAVNMGAPILLTRKLLPAMLGRSEAHVLNVCSIAGLVASPRLAAYHASKFGLVGFSESLRAEYGPRGLGVTALCPGFVRTDIYRATVTVSTTKPAPTPPRFLTTSPERVAQRAILRHSSRRRGCRHHAVCQRHVALQAFRARRVRSLAAVPSLQAQGRPHPSRRAAIARANRAARHIARACGRRIEACTNGCRG